MEYNNNGKFASIISTLIYSNLLWLLCTFLSLSLSLVSCLFLHTEYEGVCNQWLKLSTKVFIDIVLVLQYAMETFRCIMQQVIPGSLELPMSSSFFLSFRQFRSSGSQNFHESEHREAQARGKDAFVALCAGLMYILRLSFNSSTPSCRDFSQARVKWGARNSRTFFFNLPLGKTSFPNR